MHRVAGRAVSAVDRAPEIDPSASSGYVARSTGSGWTVICDVCGHRMRRLPSELNRRHNEDWLCSWCYAVATVGSGPQKVSRPTYLPMDLRWERAVAEGFPLDVSHAYGYFNMTLCGTHRDGISSSPYPWISRWVNACQACKDAAAAIDRRWPLEKRDATWMRVTPPSGSEWPPF